MGPLLLSLLCLLLLLRVQALLHLAELLLTNQYMNGECIRIDGAIRMAPR